MHINRVLQIIYIKNKVITNTQHYHKVKGL